MTEHTTPQPSAAEAEYEALVDPEFITVPRRLPLSLRIVRTTVLDELRADVAQADKDVKAYEAIADTWAEAYETEARLANEAEKRADDAERVANEIADTLRNRVPGPQGTAGRGADLTDILSNGDARIEDAIREIAGVLNPARRRVRHRPGPRRRGEAQLAVIGQTDRRRTKRARERDEADRLLRAAYRYPHESTSPALIADHLSGCEQCAAALREIPDEDLLTVREFAVFDQSARANQLICAEARRRQPTFSTLSRFSPRCSTRTPRRQEPAHDPPRPSPAHHPPGPEADRL